METSFDVRIYAVLPYRGARGTTYAVRWQVQGRRFRRTFTTRKLADAFRAQLKVAAQAGQSFVVDNGLPLSMQEQAPERTWMQHAMAYVDVKWAHASARHRRGIAEALTDVTIATMPEAGGRPPVARMRRVLFRWAFNTAARSTSLDDEHAAALAWLTRHSPPLVAFSSSATLRQALDRIALRQDGRPAAASTVTRKRATLHNVLEYAVEVEAFPSNPLHRVRWRPPRTTEVVDRRVVVNPTQARALLDAVQTASPALTAYFASLYYAGLRPGEAIELRREDLQLPMSGWGQILLSRSHQRAGAAWTDTATAGEVRGLKHRGREDTRPVPAHPDLVATLTRHLETFPTGAQGHLFAARTGRAGTPLSPPYHSLVSAKTIYRVWAAARRNALTRQQADSVLARRPYDLRHACLSTWLNAGVPPARVAEWAGHSVDVLLRIYANCVEGDDKIALTRISEELQ
ncbi:MULTISPECIES: site-specific integrase [unclassified Nocardioides]|uniref:tyrosine-type recombinase/integrase n=1 Tax=unclassified Nocardioides TaxID=2615069 RepID=UPI0000EB602E|nr:MULTISPECIES: site-specific integrase [unclassified Nocardioides]ABL80107.1 phage integrase family protein [Nocardioides sp. JS614]